MRRPPQRRVQPPTEKGKEAQETSTTSLGPRFVFFVLFFALLTFFLQISHNNGDERHLHSQPPPQQQRCIDARKCVDLNNDGSNNDRSNHRQGERRRGKKAQETLSTSLGPRYVSLFILFCSTDNFFYRYTTRMEATTTVTNTH
jgi:hypothetical protein